MPKARIAGMGRGNFPSQVVNALGFPRALGFPGIFRGVLDRRARTIPDQKAAAQARRFIPGEPV